jgi:hypothetical protein
MGFFARYSDAMKAELGYTFATIAVPGTTPRAWYYMLRDAAPASRHYRAIVIALDDFDDEETYEDHADRETDLHYLVARLRWSDLFEFSHSFRSHELRHKAMLEILLKGTIYKTDFLDLLMHRKRRLFYAQQARDGSAGWYYDYVGPDTNVKGVEVDFNAKKLHLPPGVPASDQGIWEGKLLVPRAPDIGRQHAYMTLWLNRIYDLYRGSDTRLIFIRLPRGPYQRQDSPQVNPHSSVRELAGRREVILDSEHTFDSLEDPALFMDYAHLNGPGCAEFSRMLARRVRELLGPAN